MAQKPHHLPSGALNFAFTLSSCPLGSGLLTQLLQRLRSFLRMLGYLKGEDRKSGDGLAVLPSSARLTLGHSQFFVVLA